MYALLLLTISSLLSLSAYAAGPSVIAKVDRQLWQEPVNTAAGFDKASRATVLLYALSLQDGQKLSDTDMKKAFDIKSVNRASLTKWFNKELALALHNYQQAAKSCTTDDWTCLGTIKSTTDLIKQAEIWRTKIPAVLSVWRDNVEQFNHIYTAEQMRLAALFPNISSEIDIFSDNELTGDDFPDRQFLLTFDDGPTDAQGNTDAMLTMLAEYQTQAVFFVIGESLQHRLSKNDASRLATLYKNQCVGLHGWEHKPHTKWAGWQNSVSQTKNLLTKLFPKQKAEATGRFAPLFRPPYGQRRADSGDFFKQQNLRVVLWNIDAQDWNGQMEGDDILNRVRTLMLIKRKGVLLFHDTVPKANLILPTLFNELGNAVEWRECQL